MNKTQLMIWWIWVRPSRSIRREILSSWWESVVGSTRGQAMWKLIGSQGLSDGSLGISLRLYTFLVISDYPMFPCRSLTLKLGLRSDYRHSPHGLTFPWWGCYGLCLKHKSTELAHSFFFKFCSCVYFSLFALSTVFLSINSPDKSPFSHSVLPILSLALLVLSTVCLLMKVSFSPDIIPSGWLGSKH